MDFFLVGGWWGCVVNISHEFYTEDLDESVLSYEEKKTRIECIYIQL